MYEEISIKKWDNNFYYFVKNINNILVLNLMLRIIIDFNINWLVLFYYLIVIFI